MIERLTEDAMRMRLGLALALLAGGSSSLAAQSLLPPLAPDVIPVSSHPGDQLSPKTVMAGDGSFVVAWTSKEDLSHLRIWARWFDRDGIPMAGEFQVSQSAVGDQDLPAISGSGPGDFVVVWQSTLQDGSQSGIYARRYIGGNPAADEFQVNTETLGDQKLPAVASAPDGSFVVVWETDHVDATMAEIVGQRFDASGNAVGSEFPINDLSDGVQARPSVAMDDAGEFIVTWDGDPSADPSHPDVHGRLFANDGTPAGSQFRINTTVDLDQTFPAVAMSPSGRFTVVWKSTPAVGPPEVRGRIFDGPRPEGPDFAIGPSVATESPSVSMVSGRPIVAWQADSSSLDVQVRSFDLLGRPGRAFQMDNDHGVGPAVAGNAFGRFAVVWAVFAVSPDPFTVFGRIGGAPDALVPAVDPPASLSLPFNGILESGEPAIFAPRYLNTTDAPLTLTGTLVPNMVGPPGASTSVLDGSADYGTLDGGAIGDCASATGDCYVIEASRGPNHPYGHFDTSYKETLSNGFVKVWTMHLGASFDDVALTNLYYPFIEALTHFEATVGCDVGLYCSDLPVTRAEMAAFLLKSRYGVSHLPPPATGTVFGDVPSDGFAAEWIEELSALGVTAGCGGGNYCPNDPVTRDQMAVFLLKTLEGSGYTPPDATGIFGDVPADDPFAPWIEDLASRQVTGGCQASPLLYCPGRPTSRGEMAVFLTKTFELVVYGP